MRDESRKIIIDGAEYLVDRTFDDSAAIFKPATEKGKFAHISKDPLGGGLHIQSLIEGFDEEDCVIILARRSK